MKLFTCSARDSRREHMLVGGTNQTEIVAQKLDMSIQRPEGVSDGRDLPATGYVLYACSTTAFLLHQANTVGQCAQLPPLPGKRHKWSKPRPYLVRCRPVTKLQGCRLGFHLRVFHNGYDITLVAVLTDVSTARCCGLPLNKVNVYRLSRTIVVATQEAAPHT